MNVDILNKVENAVSEKADRSFRNHLGASMLGKECPRAVWYAFRWFGYEHFPARMLRLFDRGQREESVFETLLRDAGYNVVTHDQEGNQFRISDFGGHFGGSLDGVIEIVGMGWGLLEFKTHNDKSFKILTKEGVEKAKYQHYVQMQIYMGYTGLQFALYCAVNKNDDHLHFETVNFDESVFNANRNKAYTIIYSDSPPEKIAKTKAWFQCKMCPFKDVCHSGDEPMRSCRSCAHVQVKDDGTFFCKVREIKLSRNEQELACLDYTINKV